MFPGTGLMPHSGGLTGWRGLIQIGYGNRMKLTGGRIPNGWRPAAVAVDENLAFRLSRCRIKPACSLRRLATLILPIPNGRPNHVDRSSSSRNLPALSRRLLPGRIDSRASEPLRGHTTSGARQARPTIGPWLGSDRLRRCDERFRGAISPARLRSAVGQPADEPSRAPRRSASPTAAPGNPFDRTSGGNRSALFARQE